VLLLQTAQYQVLPNQALIQLNGGLRRTKNLVDVAKVKGIEHFVFVSSVYFQLFHPLNLFWLILVWKKRAESISKSGLTYTIVWPGV